MAKGSKSKSGGLGLLGVTVVLGICVSWWKWMGYGFEDMPWLAVWTPALVSVAVNLLVAVGACLTLSSIRHSSDSDDR